MTVELVIFDCDGVLVDSEPIANRVLSECLNEAGFQIDVATATRRFVGRSLRSCLDGVERQSGRPLPAGLYQRVQERTFAAFRASLKPIPGVVEALARISLPCCVASSGDLDKLRVSLGVTGL